MCNYQTLYHDDNTGYIIRCLDCDKIQIGYGNLMLTLNADGFEVFHGWLKKVKDQQHPSQKETLRCIAIPTPCEGIKLLLSLRELNEFDAMMEEADTELRSTALIKLFRKE